MSYLGTNIRILRKQKDLTQVGLASILEVKRASIGSYEEDRSEPRLDTLKKMCQFFNVTLDDLVNIDFSKVSKNDFKIKGEQRLRILTITVDKEDDEFITLVPVKAAAGYLDGFGDIDFIEDLPKFHLPFPELSLGRTYRAFEISGDSMLPITSGSYVLCEYVEEIKQIKSGTCHVLISANEGIVYKRVINELVENEKFILVSDNKNYEPYRLEADEVKEAWKAVGYFSFSLPDENSVSINDLSEIVYNLQEQLKGLNR